MVANNWNTGVSGTWETAANWSTGAVPGLADDVMIAAAPAQAGTPYVVADVDNISVHSLTLNQALATLSIGVTQSSSQYTTLTVATDIHLAAGLLELSNTAVQGGTFVATGGTLVIASSTYYPGEDAINNAAVDGNLAIVASADNYSPALLLAGDTFAGANGTGAGTLSIGNGLQIDLQDGTTLSNVALDLSTGANISANGGSNTFTLAANASISAGYNITPYQSYSLLSGNIVNNGIIADQFAGANLNLQGGVLANAGTLSVSNGGTVDLVNGGFTNTGLISVGAGSRFSISENFTLAQLGRVQLASGGTLAVTGNAVLTNTGTLAVGPGSNVSTLTLLGGTIQGGTIANAGAGLALQSGTLNTVTYLGALAISNENSYIDVAGSINLEPVSGSGRGSIALTGAYATLAFQDNQTLSNTTISIGNASVASTLSSVAYSNFGPTLTLANTVTIQQTGAYAQIGSFGAGTATVLNQGTITGAQYGGVLTLAGFVDNTGTIAVSNGETLAFYGATLTNTGTISVTNGQLQTGSLDATTLSRIKLVNSAVVVNGVLGNAANTLNIGAGSAIPVLKLQNEILGGTIHDAGGGLRVIGNQATLQDVTYEGLLSIARPLAALSIAGSFTATGLAGTGPGTIALTGAGSILYDVGSQAIGGGGQALDNATLSIGSNARLYLGHTIAAPTLQSSLGNTPLQLGAHLITSQTGTYAAIGNELTSNYANAGTINAGVALGQFAITANNFTNTGTIAISSTDTLTSDAGSLTNTGLITIGTGAELSLDLYAYFKTGNLSDQSVANAGIITLAGGTLAEQTGAGTFATLPILNAPAGTITGHGTLATQIVNQGTITATGGTLALTTAVSGTGTLEVTSGATLSLAGVAHGETAIFAGTGGVLALAPLAFQSTIAGFAAGDTVDLTNTHANAAAFNGSSIAVTLTTGQIIKLATTTALSGALTATAGMHNDTLLSFAGTTPHAAAPPDWTAPSALALTCAFHNSHDAGWLIHLPV